MGISVAKRSIVSWGEGNPQDATEADQREIQGRDVFGRNVGNKLINTLNVMSALCACAWESYARVFITYVSVSSTLAQGHDKLVVRGRY